jgi:hypothetical protein
MRTLPANEYRFDNHLVSQRDLPPPANPSGEVDHGASLASLIIL